MVKQLDDFTAEQVERARRYHRPLHRAYLIDLVTGFGLLSVLAFTSWGDWLYRRLAGLPWWGRALAFSGLISGLSVLVRLPLSYWRGFVYEKKWGFSTQTVGAWLVDRLKAFGVTLVLGASTLLGFVALARALPHAWPVVTAVAAALLVLVLSFLAPVVLEPIFNKFAPLGDQELVADIRSLAQYAGVPIRDVLVADASRRTRKGNAYVSGLGKTRRVVIFDTLLKTWTPQRIRLVAAHELGHRRLRHVAQGTAYGMAGMAAGVVILWMLLRNGSVLGAVGATGPGDPRVIPFILLVSSALQVLSLPFDTALSRYWERAADRFSLELTGDLEAFVESHRGLALSNMSDLDPPRALYLLLFTHPTPPERIEAARRWATERSPATTG